MAGAVHRQGPNAPFNSINQCAHSATQADPQSPQAPPPERSPSFEFSPPVHGAGQQGTPQRPGAGAAPSPGSPLRASVSPGEARALKAASRRAAAAEWIRAQTGIEVPAETDFVFRQALRDGVALCRLLNSLRAGAISKVGGRGQRVNARDRGASRCRQSSAACIALQQLRVLPTPSPSPTRQVIDHSTAECSSPTGDVIRTFENVRRRLPGWADGSLCVDGMLTSA